MNRIYSMKGGPRPHYRHGCPGCSFLGSYVHGRDGVHDLYLCGGNLVAVRSDDPDDTFGIPASSFGPTGTGHHARAYPSLAHGRRLAREKGLL